MLRSISAGPAAAATAAASRITSGSEPKSWIETGPSSGWMRSISVERAPVAVGDREARDHLRDRQPGAVALRLQAHEPVADPGERREQDAVGELDVGRSRKRRSVSGGSARAPPHRFRSQISRRPVSVSRSSTSSIVSQKGTIACARPPVAISVGSPPSSRLDPARDPVDQPGEAEDHARLDRAAGRLADRGLRLGELDPADPRAALGQRRERDLDPGRDRAAEVLAVGRDRVEVDPGAEVDDDAGAADPLVGGDRVDQPVGADLVAGCRSGSASRSSPRGRSSGTARRSSAPPSPRTGCPAAARPRRRRSRRSRRARSRSARAARRSARRSRRRSRPRRCESASARPARRRRRRRDGSGCCRRRSRAAWRRLWPG